MIISGTNKTKTKNDLSDDGEDDYTLIQGETSRPTTNIGVLTLALMLCFVLTRPWKALCVCWIFFFFQIVIMDIFL